MPFGIDLGDIEDLAKEYGPSAAIGGGIGFFTGGPVGAAIGAGSAVASQYAAGKAVKALPEGTPDWAKTGVEYGIYGLGGGLGLSGAGKAGAKLALDRLALGEALKLGLLSGGGAAGGQQAARVMGVPDTIGEIVGSVAAPGLGPLAFQGLRGAAYRSANPMAQQLAETLGATEANSVKASRVMDPLNVPLVSREDTIQGLQSDLEHSQFRVANYKPELDNAGVLEATGGYTPEHLMARMRNQLPPDFREAVTPDFLKKSRSLISLNRRIQSGADAVDLAQAQVEETANALQKEVPGMPSGPGELVNQGQAYIWRAADGSETAIPDKIAENYQATTAQLAQAHEAARAKLDGAIQYKSKIEDDLRRLLGTNAIPESLDDQTAALRDKMIPNWRDLIQGDTMLTPEDARARYAELQRQQGERKLKYDKMVGEETNKQQYLQDYIDYLHANPHSDVPGPGMRTRAVQAFQAWKQSEADRLAHPTGYTAAREASESFGNYIKYAQHVASAQPDTRRGQTFLDIIQNPRGDIYMPTEDGIGVEKKYIVPGTIDPTKGTIGVRSLFQAANEHDTVPVDKLIVRYNGQQLANRAQEWQQAVNTVGDNPDVIPPEASSSERFYGSHAQLDLAQQQWEKAGGATSGIPMPDGPVIEDNAVKAWEEYNSYLLPSSVTLEDRYFTPEYRDMLSKGMQNLLMKAPRPGSTIDEIQTIMGYKQFLARGVQERQLMYASVQDQEILAKLGAVFTEGKAVVNGEGDVIGHEITATDPLVPVLMLMSKSVDEFKGLVDNDKVNFWGSLGNFLEHHVVGESVTDPGMRAMLQHYTGSVEAAANFVGGTYSTINMAAARAASALLEEPTGVKASLAAAADAAGKELPFHPLKATIAGIDNLHPLSRQDSMRRLFLKKLDVERLPYVAQIKSFEAAHPEYEGQVQNWLASQWRTFVDHPEAFGDLGKNPDFLALRQSTLMLDQTLDREIEVLGAKHQSAARRMSMLVSKDYRDYPDLEKVAGPVGASQLNPMDLVEQVVKGVNLKNPGKVVPFENMLVHGAEADMGAPLAGYQSIAMTDMFDKLKGLANDGETVTRDNLVFTGGHWEIKGLNKWSDLGPEGMKSLQGVVDIMSGKHNWAGLQQLTQRIAMGNLAADLSVLGIQGFKYLAHSMLTNPLNAVKTIGLGMTHIMSDYGFYSWMRTNLDEIMYYSQLGLTGGLKGYIAGPDVRRLPLESIPILGKAMTGIREGTDLQFNRMLYYWKVESIRQNLEFAKTMQAAGRDIADRFIGAAPTQARIRDEMGGLDAYLLGSHEDIVRTTIRQVNRSLGGVNMNAEGISPMRQAVEQIMMIVPGFFRAQAGQWAAVITKPHTLEGQLAISMLGREYLFAGMIATGMSRLLGTEQNINWDDMSKANWLGVPLPNSVGGGTMSLLPTMAIPRLASRVLKDTIAKAAQGQFNDPSYYLEQFGRGRLSPLTSPLYDAIDGHDFYGRAYTDNLDKWGSILSGVALPIVADSAVQDLKEGLRGGTATGQINWNEIAADTGIQLLGKNLVPQSPGASLNKIAQQGFGSDWNMLTDAQKQSLRTNPATVAAESQLDFYNARRATSAQAHVDMAYKDYADNTAKVWQTPQMISGLTTTQAQDDQLLQAGKMDGNTWRDRYHTRQQAVALNYQLLGQRLKEDGLDPDQVRKDKMDRLAQSHDPSDFAWLVQQAKNDYTGVKPGTTNETIATPQGEMTVQQTNWDKFKADREAVLSKYPAAVADAVKHGAKAGEDPGIVAYRNASEAQQAIEDIPRYRGLSVIQGQKLDAMLSTMAKMSDQLRASTGVPAGTTVPGLAEAVQQAALRQLVKDGQIQDQQDMKLAALAVAMQKDSKLTDSLRNPAQMSAILSRPDAVLYFPYLRYRLPKQLWNRLPQQIFQSPVAQAELQAPQ